MFGQNDPTVKFLILETHDTIKATDEYYDGTEDAWLRIEADAVGEFWNADSHLPIRRVNPDYAPG